MLRIEMKLEMMFGKWKMENGRFDGGDQPWTLFG